MDTKILETLINKAQVSPAIFKETAYWERYREQLVSEVNNLNIDQLRSGKHSRFASFGFNEFTPPKSFYEKSRIIAKLIFRYLFSTKQYFATELTPYSVTEKEIQEMAFRHCLLVGELTRSKNISSIEASSFGSPQDFFSIENKSYTMSFLDYYLRYCFAHDCISFKGNEVIVELGTGSGHQIEILKKLYPDLTILCFDLPVPLFLCNQYLSNVLEKNNIVNIEETLNWNDLTGLKKGGIHFFGNWQFPLLKNFKFDLFWNAASFGEMEPEIVNNYLSYVLNNCNWIYLLQARHGKNSVERKIAFNDYNKWLKGYGLVKEQDSYQSYRRLVEESSYFEAVWKLNPG